RRLLEHHADPGAEHVKVDRRVEQIFAVEYDLAGRALAGVERIHPIERAQQRRLAATGRPDERRHMTLGDIEIDVLERVEFAVIEIERANRHLGGREWRVVGARFDGGDKRGHRGHRAIRWRNTVRARTFKSNTASVISSAPAHANCGQSLYGLLPT